MDVDSTIKVGLVETQQLEWISVGLHNPTGPHVCCSVYLTFNDTLTKTEADCGPPGLSARVGC